MINIEKALLDKFPALASQPASLRKPALNLIKHLVHEDEINLFLKENDDALGFEFIDRVFDYFNFSYSVSARDRQNIPANGRVVIVANHPIGSLDGLALLKLVGEVRGDVRIVANDLLSHFDALSSLIIPVDNMGKGSALGSYRRVVQALNAEQAVILFPAGEVSRISPAGVRDPHWRPGFLHFARKTRAPVLPIRIKAKNSLLFYSASMLYKPLGTALLSDEMFKHHSRVIDFHVGEAIPARQLETDKLHDRTLVKRLRKHLYKLGRKQDPAFKTERTIAHPENRQELQKAFKKASLLGTTRDNNGIYLVDYSPDSPIIREIGRLREVAFRKVGEGSGRKRDLDAYDRHYRHLVLWDRERLEIAGAYRLGEGASILACNGEAGFYTRSLYHFSPDLKPFLEQSVELGRSFVSPEYWGKASLDYLWQGLGAYLRHHPKVRYLFGPVSMSAEYPRQLMDELVYFYSTHHACPQVLATAINPYLVQPANLALLHMKYAGLDRHAAFDLLQQSFSMAGYKIPVLFKQYAALFEDGGFQALVFSVDPDFGDCLDGLCMADLSLLKANKRERYIASTN